MHKSKYILNSYWNYIFRDLNAVFVIYAKKVRSLSTNAICLIHYFLSYIKQPAGKRVCLEAKHPWFETQLHRLLALQPWARHLISLCLHFLTWKIVIISEPMCSFYSHVWIWELDDKESWVPKKLMLLNCGVEDSWESLGLQGDPTSPS